MMVMLLQWLGVLFIALVRAITEQEAGVEFLLPTPSNNDTSTNTELFMEYAAKACQKYSERSDSCVRALMQKYDYSSEVQFAKLLAEQTLLLQSMINNHHKLVELAQRFPPAYADEASMVEDMLPAISSLKAKAAKVYFQSLQEFPAPQWESRWRFSEEAVKSKMPHPYKSFLIYTHQPVIDNYVSAEIIRRGMWDMEKTLMVLRVMEQLGPQGQIFVDLGSNLGWFALAVAAQGHRAVAVEPWGRNLRKLRAGVSLNGLAGLVHVVGVAASDAHRDGVCIGSGDDENAANGHLQMDANMEDEGGGGGGGGACADEDSVPTAPLDALLRGAGGQGGDSFPPVAAMKIDLEHHEVEAVRGARELFLDPEARPCVVYAETFVDVIAASHPEEHSQSEYHVFFEIMVKEYGYSTYLENGAFLDHNILSSKDNVIWKVETEFVFKRNPPDPRCVVLD